MKTHCTVVTLILALLLAMTANAQTPTVTTTFPYRVVSVSCTANNPEYPPSLVNYVWQATLQGRIQSNGATITAVSFQYGPTDSYGQEVPASLFYTAPNGDVVDTANIQVNGFTLYYHYRLKVVTTSGTFYGNDLTFVPIEPAGTEVLIERICSDSPTMANFDLTNHTSNTITVQYTSGPMSGEILIAPYQTQAVFTLKYSIATFQYTVCNSLFMFQYAANNQFCAEEPDPGNLFQIYPLGRTYWNENGVVDNFFVFEVVNPNNQPYPLNFVTGTDQFSLTFAPQSRRIIFCRDQLELYYNGNAYVATSPSQLPWPGVATVSAVALSSTSTTATFAVSNNDSITHSVKLENTTGLSHTYTVPAYSSQTVTVERSNWNVKLLIPGAVGIGVVDQFITVGTVAPGITSSIVVNPDTLLIPCNISTRNIEVSSVNAWTVSTNQPWVTLSTGADSGSVSMNAVFASNLLPTPRTATLVFTDSEQQVDSMIIRQDALISNALNFDGIDDYISGATSCDVTLADGFTIEAWVYRDGTNPGAIQFISAKNLEQMEIHLNYPSNNFRFIPTNYVYIDANASIPLNVWVHIACSYSPTTAEAHCYVNGIEVTWTNGGSNPLTTPIAQTNSPLTIGRRTYGGYQYKGSIDEFRLWSGLRTLSQIQEAMYSKINPTQNPSLVAVYSFDQGIAGGTNSGLTTVLDATVNQNNLTTYNYAMSGATSNWVYSDAQNPANIDPMAPANLTVTVSGYNAHLNWLRVNTNMTGVPVTVSNYLVYFRNDVSIPWQFLAYTTGADAVSYSHLGVVRFSPSMYYHVTAFTDGGLSGSDAILRTMRSGTPKFEVERLLYRSNQMKR
ncbi:MAG: hypothetical protein OEM52_05505 [bacterium]|nr:hypothetical protein [bacterium]